MAKIDYSDYKALRKMALNYAYSKGLRSHSAREDFAQDYCMAVLQKETSCLRYQFANFVRKELGRNNGEGFTGKYYLNVAYHPVEGIKAPPVDYEGLILTRDLLRSIHRLKGQERLVAVMYLQDLSSVEIAQRLNLDKTRISQILKQIYIRLRKTLY